MFISTKDCLRRTLATAGMFAIVSLIVPQSVHAYLDPGTGSFIIQILIAAVAGIGYLVRVFWSGIKNFFTSLFSRKKIGGQGADHNHDQDQKGTS